MSLPLPKSIEQYQQLQHALEELPAERRLPILWLLARHDLFYLLRYILSTKHAVDSDGRCILDHPWLLERCREVQFGGCHGVLDIWSREHFKSTIKTFGEVIRRILLDPNVTVGIFSHTRPIAKSFLRRIKQEFETNELLKALSWHPALDDYIAWDNPYNSPKWSEDDGLTVRRNGNPAEATVEAWGLVDSSPVGRHFKILLYDDVVTDKSVTTPEQMQKTTDSWALSLNLGSQGGEEWYTGTFYSHADTYHEVMRRGYKLRLHPCYEIDWSSSDIDALTNEVKRLAWHFDKPVLMDGAVLERKRRTMGDRVFGIQMLCDANAGMLTGFKMEWLRWYDKSPREEWPGKNVVILVDPANEKKKTSDYTSMWAIGLGADNNFYALDLVRDRLSLTERAAALMDMHRRWRPVQVRYERYGIQADIPHIKDLQERTGYRFEITEVGSQVKKDDRIERLVPILTEGRMYFPKGGLWYKPIEGGPAIDLMQSFLSYEYKDWPNSAYKDMLDSLSRIAEPDLHLPWPIAGSYWDEAYGDDAWDRAFKAAPKRSHSWMSC